MKLNKRIIALMLSLTILCGLFTGCGNGKAIPANTQGIETFDVLDAYDQADYTVRINDFDVKLSIRKNGFAVSINGKNPLNVDGELIRFVDKTLYIYLNDTSINMITALADEMLSESNVPGMIAKAFEYFLGNLKEGWYAILKLPDEIKLEKYVYSFVNSTDKLLCNIANASEQNEDQVLLKLEDPAVIDKFVVPYLENDIKYILANIEKDLKKVNYISYCKELVDDNLGLIKDILDVLNLIKEIKENDIWDWILDYIKQYLGDLTEKEINELIVQNIDLDVDNTIDQMISSAKYGLGDEQSSTTIKANVNNSVISFQFSDDTIIYVKENSNSLSSVKNSHNYSIVGILLISSLITQIDNQLEKDYLAQDVSNLIEIINNAQTITCDINLPANTEFYILINGTDLYCEIYTNGSYNSDLTNEWNNLNRKEHFKLGSYANDYGPAGSNKLVGYLDSKGILRWETYGSLIDKYKDFNSIFKNKLN